MIDDLFIAREMWTGWHRPRGQRTWLLVATAVDEERCREQLDAAPRGGDYLIRAPGCGDPNEGRR